MKKFFLKPWGCLGLAAATLSLHACAPNQDTPTPTTGVDMSRYLAIGDSYTAGLSAGGLTRNSQEYAFPNLLATQMRGAAGDVAFTQPLLEDGSGSGYLSFIDLNAEGFPLSRRVAGTAVRRSIINPAACGGADTVRLLTRSALAGTLPQNLGVPGLQLSQIETANLGNEGAGTPGAALNPYFERLLPAADSRTYLQAVTTAAASATFFTFFMGLDELMPYVRSGGLCGATPNTALATQMKLNARKILSQLAGRGVPGIIAQIPPVTTLPLLSEGRGRVLQARLQASTRDTARLYMTGALDSPVSQAITDRDYVLATTIPRIGKPTRVLVGGTMMTLPYGRDIRNPLTDGDVLDFDEVSRVNSVLDRYNREPNLTPNNPNPPAGLSLEQLAKLYRLPTVSTSLGESSLRLEDVLFFPLGRAGYTFGGVVYTSAPVRGNTFSVDYYSLTPRGNGLLANSFIAAINKAYKANLPFVNVNSLPTTAQ